MKKQEALWKRIAGSILLWANVAVAMAYLLAAYCGYVHPVYAGYLSLMGLAYAPMLFLLLMFVPIWSFWHRRNLLVTAAALLLSLPRLWAFCPVNPGGPERGDFRLMTYNTYGMAVGEEGEVSTLDEILNADPDFVCIQETEDAKSMEGDFGDSTWSRFTGTYPYRSVAEGGEGIGYFSKFPAEVVVEEKSGPYFFLAVYRTRLQDRTAYIVNMHLESIGLTHSDKLLYRRLTSVDTLDRSLEGVRSRLMAKLRGAFVRRAGQAERVREVVDSLRETNPEADFFVCGDFNDTPGSYAYRTVRGDFNDAYSDGATGATHTYNKDRFYFRIDHIFYATGRWNVVSARRGSSRASDHYPLIADFEYDKH